MVATLQHSIYIAGFYMSLFGNAVIWVVLVCAVLGAVASLFNDKKGLGKEFLEGIYSIGPVFLPVAGIMASIPLLAAFVKAFLSPIFSWAGADPAMAVTSVIAVDMGGYQLAKAVALSPEGWVLASFNGYLAGATIVFSIPVGLALLEPEDHADFALGIMAGVLSIPVAMLVSVLMAHLFSLPIRSEVSTEGLATLPLYFSLKATLLNLIPLLGFVSLIAMGLRSFPQFMIRLFLGFGKGVQIWTRLVLVICVVEYFTGVFTKTFGFFPFDPIIADEKDRFRALEIAGYIGIMLSGAFPMVYLLQKFLLPRVKELGKWVGLSPVGSIGILSTSANILALFRLIPQMPARDRVLTVSFAVCGSFLLGDHLAFTANFQPSLLFAVLMGKLIGGVSGFVIASIWVVPRVLSRKPEESYGCQRHLLPT